MKPILIVAPYFAPQSHAAMFRAFKLAKYLPQYGWQPFVLTIETNYLTNEDPTLLDELPPEVEIIPARYIEPSIRGVRMALGGPDQTFAAMKDRLTEDAQGEWGGRANAPTSTPRPLLRAASAAYSRVRTQWLNAPDAFWTWERPAIRAGKALMERHGIDLVLSTGMPYTAHRVGRALQKHGARWVADFRDPMGYGIKMTSPSTRVLRKQQEVVRETLAHADAITCTANSFALIFTDIFGEVARRPIKWIPTGVDEALLPDEPAQCAEPYLLYIGEIMPDQTETFFALLGRAMKQDNHGHKLVVVGHELMNRRRLDSILVRFELSDRVEFIDHVPQAHVYRLLAGARAGMLVPGATSYWWNLHAKLVDYVGLRKPVLAMVPDPSEARSVLNRTGLGILVDGDGRQAVSTLVAFLNDELTLPEPNAEECNRFLAAHQLQAFAELFASLNNEDG